MNKKDFRIAMAVMTAIIAVLIGLNICVKEKETWDVSHEMANAQISWQQTFHGGPWN